MSRDLYDLIPTFRAKVVRLLADCGDKDVVMRPFFTLRTPFDQAKIWRSTRSVEEVEDSCRMLEDNDALFLADVLWRVGPQFAPRGTRGHLTYVLPGQSWHQWGEAVDCYWYDPETRSANWDDRGYGYKTYAEIAQMAGMEAGFYWRSRDAVHVQSQRRNVLEEYNWADLSRIMEEKFVGVVP